MIKRSYKMDGKKYEITLGDVQIDNSGLAQQQFTINGQTFNLQEIELSADKEDSHRIKLEGSFDKKHIAKRGNEDGYIGVTPDEIFKLMEYRVKNNEAGQLEKVALCQLNFDQMSCAEYAAQNNHKIEEREYNVDFIAKHKEVSLTHAQIIGEVPLPDLKKEFPWAYENKSTDGVLRYVPMLGTNAKARDNLKRIRQTVHNNFDGIGLSGSERVNVSAGFYAYNDERIQEIKKALALQEKTAKAKANITLNAPLDEKTERLVAAAESHAQNHAPEKVDEPVRTPTIPNPLQQNGVELSQ